MRVKWKWKLFSISIKCFIYIRFFYWFTPFIHIFSKYYIEIQKFLLRRGYKTASFFRNREICPWRDPVWKIIFFYIFLQLQQLLHCNKQKSREILNMSIIRHTQQNLHCISTKAHHHQSLLTWRKETHWIYCLRQYPTESHCL